MGKTGSVKATRIIEENGQRFVVVPEKELRDLLARVDDLQDALEMKRALARRSEFLTLEELDAELAKAGVAPGRPTSEVTSA